MEAQGYRKQQEGSEEQAPPGVEVTSSGSSVLVGAIAVVVTVAALVFLMGAMNRERAKDTVADAGAAGPEAQAGGPAGEGSLASGDIGNEAAPIQVAVFPGHCEGNMRACQALRDLATAHPDQLFLSIRPMGSPEASEKGLSCASYIMKFDKFADLGASSMGQTPDGFEILVQKSPDVGGWTVEGLSATVTNAILLAGGEIEAPAESASPEADEADGAADATDEVADTADEAADEVEGDADATEDGEAIDGGANDSAADEEQPSEDADEVEKPAAE